MYEHLLPKLNSEFYLQVVDFCAHTMLQVFTLGYFYLLCNYCVTSNFCENCSYYVQLSTNKSG